MCQGRLLALHDETQEAGRSWPGCRGSKGVLGSWFRKKVLQLVIEGREETGALERVCKDPVMNKLMGGKDIWTFSEGHLKALKRS